MFLTDMMSVAKQAAKAGGAVLVKYASQHVSFREKSDKTFVSIADEESEKVITRVILEAFPDHEILGEETGQTGTSTTIWHIDPLDGTINFKSGFPLFCVSIGIEQHGEFILGVIYNPLTDELYAAEKGKGAFLNDKKIHVNTLSSADGVHVVDASFRDERTKRKLLYITKLTAFSSRLRMIGSSALQLCDVATGNCVSSLSDSVHSYDFAAGIVIVREAGGIVTDQYGNSPSAKSVVVIASNNKEHDKFVAITKDCYVNYRGV